MKMKSKMKMIESSTMVSVLTPTALASSATASTASENASPISYECVAMGEKGDGRREGK
jgi:hypothetical protein